MERILLAIDSNNMNMNALEITCYLAKLTKSKITGVFLENPVFAERPELKQIHSKTYTETNIESDLPDYPEKQY